MTDYSSFANSLTEPLRQPLWWAALASVSLHGVLGVSAPTISNIIYGGGNSKNRPGSVGLIELTPSEVGRLPATVIPARPTKNNPFSIPPAPLQRGNPTPLVQLVPPTLDIPPPPQDMPPPNSLPPEPLSSRTLNPSSSTPQASIPKKPQPKTPPVILKPFSDNSAAAQPLPETFIDRNPPPPPPSSPSSLSEGLPNFVIDPDDRAALRRARDRSGVEGLSDPDHINLPDYYGRGNTSGSETDRSLTSGTDRPITLTHKDLNKRGQRPETPTEIALRQRFEDEQRRLKRESGSGLSADEETLLARTEKYVALLESFKRLYPDLETGSSTRVNIPYPAAACAEKLGGVAVFGAVVSPAGTLVALPPIAPTGYSILDNAATKALSEGARFSPASTHKFYPVAIEFKYDPQICSAVPATNTPAPTQAQPSPQSPTPAPVPPANQRPSPAPAPVEPKFEKPEKTAPVRQPSPQPQPAPASPSPQPKPAPVQQQPSPRQQPAPEPAPAPTPASPPAPEPTTTPQPSPSPTSEPTTTSEPSPSPTTEPTTTPEPLPTQAPEPTTTPAPASPPPPEPLPKPTSSPAS